MVHNRYKTITFTTRRRLCAECTNNDGTTHSPMAHGRSFADGRTQWSVGWAHSPRPTTECAHRKRPPWGMGRWSWTWCIPVHDAFLMLRRPPSAIAYPLGPPLDVGALERPPICLPVPPCRRQTPVESSSPDSRVRQLLSCGGVVQVNLYLYPWDTMARCQFNSTVCYIKNAVD